MAVKGWINQENVCVCVYVYLVVCDMYEPGGHYVK